MFERISFTWSAMGSSWSVLMKQKKLLVFPLLSGIACLLILVSFAIPIVRANAWEPPGGDAEPIRHVLYWGTMFVFYFLNYFVITFFNSAVVGAAVQNLSGHDVTMGSALRSATNRLPQILGWALVAATVGLILRAIEQYSERVGQFVAAILGAVWTATTFMVVPILVVEGKGPIDAFRRSTSLLRETWGEQLVSNFSFGIIFFLLAIPAFVMLVVGVALGGAVGGVIAIALAVIYLIVLALVQSVLQSIFQAVLYIYVESGKAPAGFRKRTLRGAMSSEE